MKRGKLKLKAAKILQILHLSGITGKLRAEERVHDNLCAQPERLASEGTFAVNSAA